MSDKTSIVSQAIKQWAREQLTGIDRVLVPTNPSAFDIEDYRRRIATARALIAKALKELD